MSNRCDCECHTEEVHPLFIADNSARSIFTTLFLISVVVGGLATGALLVFSFIFEIVLFLVPWVADNFDI